MYKPPACKADSGRRRAGVAFSGTNGTRGTTVAFLKKLLGMVEPDDVINEVVSILKPFVDNVGDAFENAGQKELFHSFVLHKDTSRIVTPIILAITEFRGGDPSNPAMEIVWKKVFHELFGKFGPNSSDKSPLWIQAMAIAHEEFTLAINGGRIAYGRWIDVGYDIAGKYENRGDYASDIENGFLEIALRIMENDYSGEDVDDDQRVQPEVTEIDGVVNECTGVIRPIFESTIETYGDRIRILENVWLHEGTVGFLIGFIFAVAKSRDILDQEHIPKALVSVMINSFGKQLSPKMAQRAVELLKKNAPNSMHKIWLARGAQAGVRYLRGENVENAFSMQYDRVLRIVEPRQDLDQ